MGGCAKNSDKGDKKDGSDIQFLGVLPEMQPLSDDFQISEEDLAEADEHLIVQKRHTND